MNQETVSAKTDTLSLAISHAKTKYNRKFELQRKSTANHEDKKHKEHISHVTLDLVVKELDTNSIIFSIRRKIPVLRHEKAPDKKWIAQEFEELAGEALITLTSYGMENILTKIDDPTENQAKATWKGSDV